MRVATWAPHRRPGEAGKGTNKAYAPRAGGPTVRSRALASAAGACRTRDGTELGWVRVYTSCIF
jgi:hypothetical protein